MIQGIKFASVPVRDQDKALEFYTTKLGFKIVTDSPFNGQQRWIELGMPRAETRLVLFTAEGQEKQIGGFMNLTFMAEDVEATAKEMKALDALMTGSDRCAIRPGWRSIYWPAGH